MNCLGLILVMALATITFVSAAYPQVYPQTYPQTYRYNLTLQTGNHSFVFKGLTKIRFSLHGYNYSYTNLTYAYKWIDYPEFLIYRPKLIVKSFSIIPIYKYNHQVYRDAEARNHQQQDIDLNLYDLNQYDVNQYGLNHYDVLIDPARYDLESQYYNLKNPNHRPINYNHRPNSNYLSTNQLNYRPNGHQNYANKHGLNNHRYRERIHKFCPPVDKQNDGIEARNATVLVRCH